MLVRVQLRFKVEERGGNQEGEENQARPISQTVNDRHIDQARWAVGSGHIPRSLLLA